jgi:hypothetical protein
MSGVDVEGLLFIDGSVTLKMMTKKRMGEESSKKKKKKANAQINQPVEIK